MVHQLFLESVKDYSKMIFPYKNVLWIDHESNIRLLRSMKLYTQCRVWLSWIKSVNVDQVELIQVLNGIFDDELIFSKYKTARFPSKVQLAERIT